MRREQKERENRNNQPLISQTWLFVCVFVSLLNFTVFFLGKVLKVEGHLFFLKSFSRIVMHIPSLFADKRDPQEKNSRWNRLRLRDQDYMSHWFRQTVFSLFSFSFFTVDCNFSMVINFASHCEREKTISWEGRNREKMGYKRERDSLGMNA